MNIDKLKDKKIGIVFSSSFFGFFAHAGFLSALRKHNIKPCAFSGTSAGALIAAFASCDIPTENLYDILMKIKKRDFWDPDFLSLTKGLFKFFKGWTGLLKGHAFRKLLCKHLPVTKFEETKVPCCIVAANISQKNKAVFTKGNLIDAVHASSAVPGLFKPVLINGELYADGGLISKAPVMDLYSFSKPDVIIVNYIVSEELHPKNYSFIAKTLTPYRIFNLADSIVRHLEYNLQVEYVKRLGCEIIELNPNVTRVRPSSLNLGAKAYKEAEDFTNDYFEKIR